MAQKSKKDESLYVGQYSLDQGGTDAAGGVHLMLFAGGDYAIVFHGGLRQGTWKPMADGTLELKEWASEPDDFVVYGSHNPNLGKDVKVEFNGFRESYAKVGFSDVGKPATSVSLHPAFNADANCYASGGYHVQEPASKLQTLYLAVYQSATETKYQKLPYTKQLLYSFPLNKQYNHYKVAHLNEASKPPTAYVGHYVNKELTLYPAGTPITYREQGDSYGKRYDISATDREGIKPYIMRARKVLPAELSIDSDEEGQQRTYQRVVGTSTPLKKEAIKLLDPLFIARCE